MRFEVMQLRWGGGPAGLGGTGGCSWRVVVRAFAMLCLSGWLASCAGGSPPTDEPSEALPEGLVVPEGFPQPPIPEDNPYTEAKRLLGQHLFFDERLSGNGLQACASCHDPAKAFADGEVVPTGSTGMLHPRNAQTLTNAAYNATLTWANPLLDTLEKQILVPMFSEEPVELGITGREAEVLERLRDDEALLRLFTGAFGHTGIESAAVDSTSRALDAVQVHADGATSDGSGEIAGSGEGEHEEALVTWPHIVRALATFTRSLISGNSRFDAYVYQGQRDALSDAEKRGMELFFSERLECHHCHGGFNFSEASVHEGSGFSASLFHNTGLYNVDGQGAYPATNIGIMELTGNPEDMGRFRAPTLRNVGVTAPYMHDGSIETLEDVVRHYEAGGRSIASGPNAGVGHLSPLKSGFIVGFRLTDAERGDLVAFLRSLTDDTFLKDPRHQKP